MAQARTRLVEVKPAVNVRFNYDDFDRLQEVAKALNVTATQFLRNMALAAIGKPA